GDGDVADPQVLQFEIDTAAMHADVGQVTTRAQHLLAYVEGCRNAHAFHRHVHAVLGHGHQFLDRILASAVDGVCRAEFAGHVEAGVVDVDDDEVGRGIELGGEQHAHAHGAGPNDRHGITGLDGAIQDADFVAGGQNVAEHDQRFFIGTFGHRVQAVVGMGNAHVFGLGAVDQVAEDPAAVFAVRVHLLL